MKKEKEKGKENGKTREFTVTLSLNEEQQEKLKFLLPAWKSHWSEQYGYFPFKDWTIEKLAAVLVEMNSSRMIDEKINMEAGSQGITFKRMEEIGCHRKRKHCS